MSLWRLVARSARFYWKTGVVVAAAVAAATAAITGSLVVGASVTGSLRDTALARLGRIDHALVAPRAFRASLARDLLPDCAPAGVSRIVPAIVTEAAASNAEGGATLPRVTAIGADRAFWELFDGAAVPHPEEGQAVLNAALAHDLGVRRGDALLLNLALANAPRFGTLFSPRARERTTRSARLEVAAVIPDSGPGSFRLDAHPSTPRDLFVPRAWLAREMGRPGTANVLLVDAAPGAGLGHSLAYALRERATLADYGLSLAVHTDRRTLSLRGGEMVLSDAEVQAARAASAEHGARAAAVSINLATTLRLARAPARRSAYAMIAGIEGPAPFRFLSGGGAPLDRRGVWLNRWSADDLKARVGDRLALTTLVPSWEGAYREETHAFTVRGVVAMEGAGADPTLVPFLAGISDADRVDAWQAPFPVEMSRVTPRDEEYWKRYRAAPKVFVALETARALWRLGSPAGETDWVTSVRVTPGPGETSAGAFGRKVQSSITARLRPEDAGLRFRAVRQEAVEAARGSTSFSQLFLGMSFFLVAAAAGLAAMTMRLLVDRRAAEAGVLLACGFPERSARRAMWAEGSALAALGALAGVPLGTAYAGAILRMLATRWVGAVGTPSLWLHADAGTLFAGGLSGLAVGIAAVAWGTRQATRRPVLELLAGWQAADLLSALRPARWTALLLWPLLAAAVVLTALGGIGALPAAGAFFGSGALFLAAGLLACREVLRRGLGHRPDAPTLGSVALRSAGANRGRSLLVVGLFASAGFILVAAGANIRDVAAQDAGRRDSGTGGFALRAVSTLPIGYDFGTPGGRERLGFPPEDEAVFRGVTVVPFLASPGDDVSCLNPTRPAAPRLLGVPPAMAARGGFGVVGPAARTGSPWEQLDQPAPGGAVPAFGDAESVQWTLHSGAGKRYPVATAAGGKADLWFAGLLPGSIFAGELLVSDRSFRRLFPSIAAPRYFLVDTPAGNGEAVAESLRRNLGDLGLEVRSTREILNDLKRVQNTYLSAFLALGGLGMLLGTFGLVAVLLRSALERRGEFGMLLALGFRGSDITRLLVLENGGLLLAGLVCGLGCGLVAVAPALAAAETRVPWGTLAALLLGMAGVGLASCAGAARAAGQGPLLSALREE